MPRHERDDFNLSKYQFEILGDQTRLTYYSQTNLIPTESLEAFIQDLSLDYSDMRLSRVAPIDAIIRGNAEFLGKGFDGIVFAVPGHAVKVSTTVPFHPMNQRHRTLSEAREHLLAEAELMDRLRDEIPCVLPSQAYEHEGRLWLVKPLLDLVEPKNLTAAQVSALADCVYGLHAMGLVIGDTLQFGLLKGKAFFLDLGQVRKADADSKRDDVLALRHLAKQAGVRLARDDELLDDILRKAKYLRFVLRPPVRKAALRKAIDDLLENWLRLPTKDQREHEEIEDLLWEAEELMPKEEPNT